MPRKKTKNTVRRTRTSPRKLAARNSCRAVIPLNQEPLRREALAGCRDVMRKLEKEEAKWRRYEQEDAPAFQRWYDKHFGKLESEVRREEALIRERYELADEVEFEFHYRGGGYRAAYRRVMEQRENPDSQEDGEPETEEGDTYDPEEEAFRSFFRDVFGIDDDEMDEMFENFRQENGRNGPGGATGSSPASATTEEKSRSARVKERFRMLARKLHPDHRKEADNPRKTELWHEAQEAYNATDLERLDTLLALCEVKDGEVTEATGLTLLDQVRARFQNSLRALRSRLRRARKDPAWNFSRNPETGKLAGRIRSELEAALEKNRLERQRLDALIAEWSQPPGRARAAAAKKQAGRPPRRKRVAENDPRQPEFTFG